MRIELDGENVVLVDETRRPESLRKFMRDVKEWKRRVKAELEELAVPTVDEVQKRIVAESRQLALQEVEEAKARREELRRERDEADAILEQLRALGGKVDDGND